MPYFALVLRFLICLGCRGASAHDNHTTCSANSGCAALTGDCCPTLDGAMLDCCDVQSPSAIKHPLPNHAKQQLVQTAVVASSAPVPVAASSGIISEEVRLRADEYAQEYERAYAEEYTRHYREILSRMMRETKVELVHLHDHNDSEAAESS